MTSLNIYVVVNDFKERLSRAKQYIISNVFVWNLRHREHHTVKYSLPLIFFWILLLNFILKLKLVMFTTAKAFRHFNIKE